MKIQYFGVRHHGAGTARHLLKALSAFQPDRILIEGPPEANALLPLVKEIKPPVALLLYCSDEPQQSVYYPFAEFSPEWQALRYAFQHEISVSLMDAPFHYRLMLDRSASEEEEKTDFFDVFGHLAGYADGERYWEALIEQRQNDEDVFLAINKLMSFMRLMDKSNAEDLLREASMRQSIRQAQKEGFQRIAVVCGAWHVPALEANYTAKDDAARIKEALRETKKIKIESTWIPWTNQRLTWESSYGSGIFAPAWYEHLWQHPNDDGVLWLSRAAAILRERHHDVSAAHIMEALRLARATATLRGQSQPNLQDYGDALTAVIGFGDETLLQSIRDEWWIGDTIGNIPVDVPRLPLLVDVEQWRKKLRLPLSAEVKRHTLDLRKTLDAQRSVFFHRFEILEIGWAKRFEVNSQGTFKEEWESFYQPEQMITLNERAVYGHTLADACLAYVWEQIQSQHQLHVLTSWLRKIIAADLPDLVDYLSHHIANLSTQQHDLEDLLKSIPHLVQMLRYGNVQNTNQEALWPLLRILLQRLAAGGVQACLHLDDDAAEPLFEAMQNADYQLSLLDDAETRGLWWDFICTLNSHAAVHPLLAGAAARWLFEQKQWDATETEQQLRQRLSAAQAYRDAALWLQGFLHQAGTLLLLNEALWAMLDDWLSHLPAPQFVELLPLLRRTFSSFEFGERRQLSDKVRAGHPKRFTERETEDIDTEQALQALQTMACLLGLDANEIKPRTRKQKGK